MFLGLDFIFANGPLAPHRGTKVQLEPYAIFRFIERNSIIEHFISRNKFNAIRIIILYILTLIINKVIRNVFLHSIGYFFVVFACTIDALFFSHQEVRYAISKLFLLCTVINRNEHD